MLTDPVEIEIISRARQEGVRNPKRSRKHFERIFDDFLAATPFAGRRLVDLGPGQWDFGVLARERGAEVAGVDDDPAVLELGRYKGFEAIEADLREFTAAGFDGVFCKFSVNAFWGTSDDELVAQVDRLVAALPPGGWSWIAPWNGVPPGAGLTPAQVGRRLTTQVETFERHGFAAHALSEELTQRYGLTGVVANNPLFVKGVAVPPAVASCPRP